MYSVTEQMVAWLLAHGYDAYTRPPKDAPHSPTHFVTVERTGGSVTDLVDHPSLAIQCWAATDEAAERLANVVRAQIVTGTRPHGVTRVDVNSGPYRFYDEYTRCPRYQMALDATCQLTD
jgi:hypothetical protein